MVRVAIAGGTGGLGRTIVDSIVSTNKHEVFILSRSAPSAVSNPAITYLKIDYTSSSAIATVLESHAINTIISALQMNTPESGESQLKLIEGANLSGAVKCFVPSEFAIDYLEAERQNFPYPGKDLKVSAIAALHKTSLKYTRLINGTFMDYLSPSSPSNILTIALFLDFAGRKAVIPGDGTKRVVFTHTIDVARIAAGLLEQEEWEEKTVVIGSRHSLNEIVDIAEIVAGRQFERLYVSVGDLKEKKIPELEYNIQQYQYVPKGMVDAIFASWGVGVLEGWLDFGEDGVESGVLGIEELLGRG